MSSNTHSTAIGYVLWIFGFTGAHRFYFGRKLTGLLWLLTGGLFGVGWLIDVFMIPRMDSDADAKYADGKYDYTLAWIFQTFLGPLGIQHFYLGRTVPGLIWLFTGGVFGLGWCYDFWRMNELVDQANRAAE